MTRTGHGRLFPDPCANIITGKWSSSEVPSDRALDTVWRSGWWLSQRATPASTARRPVVKPGPICRHQARRSKVWPCTRWTSPTPSFLAICRNRCTVSNADFSHAQRGLCAALSRFFLTGIELLLTARLRAEFALKDLGPLHYFLGIEVVRRTDGFFLHQRKYAHELLGRAGMLNCKPPATPVDTKSKLSATDGSLATDASSYRSIAGALQYLTLTRPELQYAVQQVCLQMHGILIEAAVKRISLPFVWHHGLRPLLHLLPRTLRLLGRRLGRLPRHASLHVRLLCLLRTFAHLLVV
ncbi:hypothetical protein QYE76_039084 [Lolium multiflorum]|uniref:Reverse transcriptase Ty1/copia-type domain-containing protein n=1 Tax=Lolium multiflorum TaxID=4521 RepID=A0AAD8TAS1_LOLMU|nr:hypothetical protein QYE76_039084 [Lolium multiflorum]